MDAFNKAFDLYIKMGTQEKVEMSLQTLGNWPDGRHEQESYKFRLVQILLQHRLCMFHDIFPTMSSSPSLFIQPTSALLKVPINQCYAQIIIILAFVSLHFPHHYVYKIVTLFCYECILCKSIAMVL